MIFRSYARAWVLAPTSERRSAGNNIMTSMNVSLPEDLEEYVETQTKGGYSTPSEYVHELIRGDQERRATENSMPCCWKA